MVGQGLRLARAGIRRCPRLKAALLAGLHRVPWLFSLVARLAERLRGPRATPLLEAPPPPPPSPPEARSPEHSALRLLRLAREHGGQG
jgi:hypothetical protein